MQARSEDAKKQIEADYQACCAQQQKAKTSEELRQAADAFAKLKHYKDSMARIDACYEEANCQQEEAKRQQEAKEKAIKQRNARRMRMVAAATVAVCVIVLSGDLLNEKGFEAEQNV